MNVDDPRVTQLTAAVRAHLAGRSSSTVLLTDLEAIDALRDDANADLKSQLDWLRAQVEIGVSEEENVDTSGARSLSDSTSGGSIAARFGHDESRPPNDEFAIQRTRFQTIEAEISNTDDAALAALAIEVDTFTQLSSAERTWMIDAINAETRRRTS